MKEINAKDRKSFPIKEKSGGLVCHRERLSKVDHSNTVVFEIWLKHALRDNHADKNKLDSLKCIL